MPKLLPYVVKRGDFLTKLAGERNFDANEIWQDPNNAELRQTRPDPEVLCPGDILYLPADTHRAPLELELEADNKFTTQLGVIRVRQCFVVDGQPLADMDYYVHGMGDVFEDVTDNDGGIDIDVPLHVPRVKVVIVAPNDANVDERGDDNQEGDEPSEPDDGPKQWVFEIAVGHLDPARTWSGAKQRLDHLGYLADPECDHEDHEAEIARAIQAFQSDCKLEPTGKLDDTTATKLEEAYGA